MYIHDKEINIKVSSRPLRFVYLVRNREEVIDAITLYTHIWGGSSDFILPIPQNEEESGVFRAILEEINPDYIFIQRDELPLDVDQILEKSPFLKRPISRIEIQRDVVDSVRSLPHLHGGSICHIGSILSSTYPSRLETSNIRFVEANGEFDFELALQVGIPNQTYQTYLTQHLSAKLLTTPRNIKELLQVSLTLTKSNNPLSLTMSKTRRRWDSFNSLEMLTNDPITLCIFLDDKETLDVPTLFWNSRWIFPDNKIFLPKAAFLHNIESCISLIQEFIPSIRAIFIATSTTEEEAVLLCSTIKNGFAAAGKDVLVKITYRNFPYALIPATVSSGRISDFSRLILDDSSIRFEAPAPYGHENTGSIFGYDAEIKFVNGKKLAIPNERRISLLLTNELWRIEQAENSQEVHTELWLRRDLPIRASSKGITGLTSPNKECRIHLHPDDLFISHIVKDLGIRIRPNKHTRYVQGCIKRFGGFEQVLKLLNKKGVDIISALVAHRAEQGGLTKDGIISFLKSQRGMNHKDANELIKQKLQPMLESGMLRRGYSLDCPVCNFKAWYSLTEIDEFIECKGCSSNFLFPTHRSDSPNKPLEVAYKPNELTARLVQEGGLAVLMMASFFRKMPQMGFLQFGGEIFHSNSETNFAEIDLLWLSQNVFIIAECKSFHEINDEGIINIQNSLERNIAAATQINADVVILGVTTNSSNGSELLSSINGVAQAASKAKVAVHLVLNGKLYPWGGAEVFEPHQVKPTALMLDEPQEEEKWYVGESPNHFGGAIGLIEPFSNEVLLKWDQELSTESVQI